LHLWRGFFHFEDRPPKVSVASQNSLQCAAPHQTMRIRQHVLLKQ
jgi:hypothetical protein